MNLLIEKEVKQMAATSPMPRIEDCKEDLMKCLESHKQEEKEEYWDASMISMCLSYFFVCYMICSD